MGQEPDWNWNLTPNHWIDLFVTDTGLNYVGTDWDCQSGGGYMAGFQSFEDFLRDGGIAQMPEPIAAQVRARLLQRPRGLVCTVEFEGALPHEAHLELDGQPFIKRRERVLFQGSLVDGEHRIGGILMFPGADERGRRNAWAFERSFVVPDDLDDAGRLLITQDEVKPRWPAPGEGE